MRSGCHSRRGWAYALHMHVTLTLSLTLTLALPLPLTLTKVGVTYDTQQLLTDDRGEELHP